MTGELTDVEGRALRWIRDGDARAPRLAPALVAGLTQKGLIFGVEPPNGGEAVAPPYTLTAQGHAVVEARPPV